MNVLIQVMMDLLRRMGVLSRMRHARHCPGARHVLRAVLAAASLSAGLATAGCRRDPATAPPDATARPPPESAIEALCDAPALYFFEFDGQQEPIVRLDVEYEVGEFSVNCAARSISAPRGNSERWVLAIQLPTARSATYEVSTQSDRSTDARVRLHHIVGGNYVGAFEAISGSVALGNSPTPADAKRGMRLQGDVVARFGVPWVTSVRCRGAATRDGAVVESQCTCGTADGDTFTCNNSGNPRQSCCFDEHKSEYELRLHIEAEHCAPACRVTTGTPNYCWKEFGE